MFRGWRQRPRPQPYRLYLPVLIRLKSGLVASLNRPVENATGVYILANALESKRLGLLHELFPSATMFGVLLDPKFPPANLGASELRAAASTIGQPLTFFNASTDAELDATFAALTQQHVTAMLLIGSPFFDTRRDKIITFGRTAEAARHVPFPRICGGWWADE